MPGAMAPLPYPRLAKGRQRWDGEIPHALRPLLRAYSLGYASVVAPRILALAIQHISARTKGAHGKLPSAPGDSFLASLRRILRRACHLRRFPAFCAFLIGGSTLLEIPVRRVLSRFAAQLSDLSRTRLSRWLASFLAAWFSLRLLQSPRSAQFEEEVPVVSAQSLHPPGVHPQGVEHRTIRYAGRTLDLSLFAFTRALDVIVGELWARRRAKRVAARQWTWTESTISKLTDSAMFATSCTFIMWSWMYFPSSLPSAYSKWISTAAAIDARFIEALQRCRRGELRYGEDTGFAPLVQGICDKYKLPRHWGDPAQTVPYPCEVVHMGCGPSCEYHALSRFYRSFLWSMRTYLPLNLLLVARTPNLRGLKTALASASRSSAFLGAFITLFYYGVCLARTRLGPRILGTDIKARNRIDGGICVGAGCLLCGWSILLEAPGRRKDMALFVAPRAMATVLPRRYAIGKQYRETLVFALSTAVVFTCVQENPKRVRGVLGKALASVITQGGSVVSGRH